MSTAADGSDSDFIAVLNSWREADLTSLLSQLHSQSSTIQETQTNSLLSRKKLAEQTREFKKQSNEFQLENLKPLLKSYQTEIDELTKRSKSAESGFLGVLNKLGNVKDPLRCLEVALEQAASLTELTTLKNSYSELQSELSTLKQSFNAVTSENSSLTSEISRLSSEISSKTSSLESTISSKYEERIKNLTSREEILTSSLSSNEEILSDLRKRNEILTQKLVSDDKLDLDLGDDQLNRKEQTILENEIFLLKKRINDLESRNENLLNELGDLKNGKGFEEEKRKREENQKELMEDFKRKEDGLNERLNLEKSQREKLEKQVNGLKNKEKELEVEIKRLQRNLDGKKDYDELKREVEIMRMVEFNVGYDDDEEEEEDQLKRNENGSSKMKDEKRSLESLLIEKNKKLEREVTNLRVSNSTLQSSTSSNSTELVSLRSEVSKLKILNEKLEEDLINIGSNGNQSQSQNQNQNSATEEVKGFDLDGNQESNDEAKSKEPQPEKILSAEEALAELENLSSIPSRSSKSTSKSSTTTTTPSSSSSSSLIPILTSQRDRFKTRNSELEEELRKQYEIIRDLRNELKRLNKDNLGLYEKVRYLSNYRDELNNNDQGGGFRSVQVGTPEIGVKGREFPPNRNLGGSNGVEDGYRERYEQSMNPFEAFRGREQNRVLSSLNPLERILHMLTRLVLGHRRMRLLFMIYALVLHVMVFVMLMEVGWHSSSSHERLTPVEAPNPGVSIPQLGTWT